MAIISENLKVTMVFSGSTGVISCSQNDTSRQILFEVKETIPAGTQASFRGHRSDGGYFIENCEVSGQIVALTLTNNITATAGNGEGELTLIDPNGNIVSSANMVIKVEPAPMPDGEEITPTTEDALKAYIKAADERIATMEKLIKQYNGVIATYENGTLYLTSYKGTDEDDPGLKETVQNLQVAFDQQIKSHVGQVIITSALDTMEKVVGYYGGTTWQKIDGALVLKGSDGKFITPEQLPPGNDFYVWLRTA